MDSEKEQLWLARLMQYKCISLVGGGGKTSCLYYLARQFALHQKKVLVCTTTRMNLPQNHQVDQLVLENDDREHEVLFSGGNIIMVGQKTKEGKLAMPSIAYLERWIAQADYVLCESDGTRGLPMKAPLDHEPVIFPQSKCVIALAGVSAVGRPLEEVCHRKKQGELVLKKSSKDRVSAEDLAFMLSSGQGQRKMVTEEQDYWVVINQVDGAAEEVQAKEIVEALKEKGISQVVLAAFQQKEQIRKVYI